jgi:putative transposase
MAEVRWIEKRDEKEAYSIILKDNSFKNHLRSSLLEGWSFLKHYVDSAVKQAYSMLKSWRRSYLKGGLLGLRRRSTLLRMGR